MRVPSAPFQDCSGDRAHLLLPIRYRGMVYSYFIIIRVSCATIYHCTEYISSFH